MTHSLINYLSLDSLPFDHPAGPVRIYLRRLGVIVGLNALAFAVLLVLRLIINL